MGKTKTQFIVFSFLIFQGCSLLSSVSQYDPTTYLNLLELKIYTRFLYETFTEDSVNVKTINFIRKAIEKEHQYELDKGEENKETAQQVKLILDMFNKHVDNRMNDGKWTPTHHENQMENMLELIDIVRETELLKNKPK